MTQKIVYHVLRRNDSTWQVVKEGFRRPHVISESKEQAVILARRLARVSPSARVIVHRADEAIERQYRPEYEAA